MFDIDKKKELRKFFFRRWQSKKRDNKYLHEVEKYLKIYLRFRRLGLQSCKFMAYKPFPSEIDILKILRDVGVKNIYIPKIRGLGLILKNIDSNEFIDAHQIDVMIVPALFVQKNGYRLGRGSGYYDRFLRFCHRQEVIFLGYHWQILEQIPIEQHDKKVSILITEQGITYCK